MFTFRLLDEVSTNFWLYSPGHMPETEMKHLCKTRKPAAGLGDAGEKKKRKKQKSIDVVTEPGKER